MTIFRNLWHATLNILGCRETFGVGKPPAGTFRVKAGERFEVGDPVYWDKSKDRAVSVLGTQTPIDLAEKAIRGRHCIVCGGTFDYTGGGYLHEPSCGIRLMAARRKIIEASQPTPTFQDILDQELEKDKILHAHDPEITPRLQEEFGGFLAERGLLPDDVHLVGPIGQAVDNIFALPHVTCGCGGSATWSYSHIPTRENTYRCESCGLIFTRKGTAL
jgi:hypothetical protein